MHPLARLWEKESRLVIGLMSGTSADGIDAALTRITGNGKDTKVEQLDFVFVPFPQNIREKILFIAGGGELTAGELCKFKTLLGVLYADACVLLCEHAGVSKDEIDLIGNHGQTIWHIPVEEEYLGRKFAATLQVGEDAQIAEVMHCPVVGDFRVRDVAAGGQGAPLVPYTEYVLFCDKKENVAFQNIGGIGNITILPANCKMEDVIAFDTGPGNMVIDALVNHYTKGKETFDDGGRMAASGKVSPTLLEFMMNDSYLDKPLPKTTGRELYGPRYVKRLIEEAEKEGVAMQDVIATATLFTAKSIEAGIRKFSPVKLSRLVIGGGGSKNETLLSNLQQLLPETKVLTGEDLGYSSDAKEAVAFAILANETIFGNTNNVPAVTGARGGVVMGKVTI